jgi:hypothetical protein
MDMQALHDAIASVCPIDGVSVANPTDKSTWRIDYDPSATAAQQQAAQAALKAFDPNAPVVPQSITQLQMRRALRAANLFDQVQAAINAASPDTQDAWNYASPIDRNDPILIALAVQLGLSTAQVDQLFIQAATFKQ